MNIRFFSIAFLVSLLCLSCADTNLETTAQSNETQTNGTLHTYKVDINAGTFNPSSRAALTRMADMPYKITEENLQGETVLYPKLNIPDKTTMPSLLVFYNKTNQTKRIVEANWKVKKEGSKTTFRLEHLTFHGDLSKDEWYLMAFMGGGTRDGDKLNVQLDTTAFLIKKDQTFTASCPYATTWRRIKVKGDSLQLQDTNKDMVFKPQGVFLLIDVESRMSLNTKLAREVQLESNAFSSRGAYEFDIEKMKNQPIADDADLLSEYWKPSDKDSIKNTYPVYTANNGRQYVTNIILNYQSDVPDGTVTSGKTDLSNYMYFNAAKASSDDKKRRHVTTTPTNKFLLCLMPIDYKKTAKQNLGVATEVLFYGKVFIEESTRTHYTYDQLTYQYDPSTWKPYMEKSYLLGSFSKNLAKGSCHSMRLRIVRPMLPIERLWAFRQGTEGSGVDRFHRMKPTNRGAAEALAEGRMTEDHIDGGYPGLKDHQYRFPKYSELMPIFHNCEEELQLRKPIGIVHGYDVNNEYGFANAIAAPKNQVNINGTLMKFDNWFCHQKNSQDMYGIMYIKPFGGGGPTSGNYKVAYKLSFTDPNNPVGIGTISIYYLGPNYNLSNAVAGFYCCHAGFWKKFSLEEEDAYKEHPRAIIERRFALGGDYWLNDKEELHKKDENEVRSLFNNFRFKGEAQVAPAPPSGSKNAFFLPWLINPSWQ